MKCSAVQARECVRRTLRNGLRNIKCFANTAPRSHSSGPMVRNQDKVILRDIKMSVSNNSRTKYKI